jgi:hypothetical protein
MMGVPAASPHLQMRFPLLELLIHAGPPGPLCLSIHNLGVICEVDGGAAVMMWT